MKKSILMIVIAAACLLAGAQAGSRPQGTIPPPFCPPICSK
jgi:hypothetical protein